MFVGAGHSSSFPLFHDGGKRLPPFPSELERQWSKWRARIEYCLRQKWLDPRIKISGSYHVHWNVVEVDKKGIVKVLHGGSNSSVQDDLNVAPEVLIEDMHRDPILNFPKNSRAEFVELLIILADFKDRG